MAESARENGGPGSPDGAGERPGSGDTAPGPDAGVGAAGDRPGSVSVAGGGSGAAETSVDDGGRLRDGAVGGGPAESDDGPTVALPTGDETVPLPAKQEPVGAGSPVRRVLPRLTTANAMIAVLLALLGFTLVVQLKSNSTDASLESTRQEDLVRILSDLDAQEERVRQDIAGLEESQRQLSSGAQGRQAALDEATRRADELGVLAGTLAARGPGLTVSFMPVSKPIAASRVLDAVQELRGAGAEAMQIAGGDGATVRIIASTYFLDADGGISVSGRRLTGPYMIMVIGDPKTMQTALNIPGGVVASVSGDGGNVAIQEREVVDVTALSPPKDLQHARPVS
ncbi:DUF881 domain-containing protein [Plantactinospora soyae]|uniref:Uncharacterized protein YlxW (UPF0749 family) n=1 Tax=Plantactinospora soyae TaxID=1544732 RepID=A0A927R0R6_9ACTN|nr:DUF881 domain-containing protein [Plantactinospora soyae]MBE1490517.1 uncharacterized protein YlxW (UPF0749 family) [Plantactinospora soyae]